MKCTEQGRRKHFRKWEQAGPDKTSDSEAHRSPSDLSNTQGPWACTIDKAPQLTLGSFLLTWLSPRSAEVTEGNQIFLSPGARCFVGHIQESHHL